MKDVLLDYLVCPDCQCELDCRVEHRSGGEILEGQLRCGRCAGRYPILRGIPRFVGAQALDRSTAETVDGFGWEWQVFDVLHDPEQYRSQFVDWIAPLPPEHLRGKVVLDAGCGMGRFSGVSSSYGASLVLAVDASASVEPARNNTASHGNVEVIQADLCRMPLRRRPAGQIDFAFSIGVLHHLKDPREGFNSVVRHLRPGGRMFAWVYGRENNGWIVHLVNPLRRGITSRLPRPVLYALSWILTLGLHPAIKLLYSPHAPRWLRRSLPYSDYLSWLARYGFRHNHSVVFDHLVPTLAHYIRREEFEDWFRAADMKILDVSWRNRNSWRGHGQASA